jgi:hypothetical protein
MPGKTKSNLLPAYGLTIAFLLFISFTSTSFAQEYSKLDSLKIGNRYKIILFDDTEIIGKIVSSDSVYIVISTAAATSRIKKDDIFNISTDLTPSKYKFTFSAGGGISLLSGGFFDDGYRKTSSSFSVQLNSTFITSSTKGFRIDLGYSRFKRKIDDPYMVDYQGGDIGMMTFKTDFVAGDLSPSSVVNAYALIGLGLHIIKEESYSYKYRYYDSSAYYTYTTPERSSTNVVFSIGGGLAFRFTKHLGVYSEIQYNMITYGGWFFFYGVGAGYFPIRAGLTYYLY